MPKVGRGVAQARTAAGRGCQSTCQTQDRPQPLSSAARWGRRRKEGAVVEHDLGEHVAVAQLDVEASE